MQLRLLLLSIPAAWAVRLQKSGEKVEPKDIKLSTYWKGMERPTENECYTKITRTMCEKPPKMLKNYTAHAVFSVYREDIHWLNVMPWSDKMTVYVHNRSQARTHQSTLEKSEHQVMGEVSQEKVEMVNDRRTNPIVFRDIPNQGDEAAAYLQFIVENYDKLPDMVFFLQGHRCTHHANFDMAIALPNIRKCWNPDQGYLDLNTYSHFYTTPPTKCKLVHEIKEMGGITGYHIEKFSEIWEHLFKGQFGKEPVKICYDPYAQFAVSKSKIQQHPKEFYELLYKGAFHGKTTMEFFWRTVWMPWDALSWKQPAPKDWLGRPINNYKFTEEELRENARDIDEGKDKSHEEEGKTEESG